MERQSRQHRRDARDPGAASDQRIVGRKRRNRRGRARLEGVLDALRDVEPAAGRAHAADYHGVDETLEQIAQTHNLSRERIRQIESKALRKMRAHLSRILDEYEEDDLS